MNRPTPHVTKDKDDTIVQEYWNKNRKLTIYCYKNETPVAIKVWGVSMISEMEDVEIINTQIEHDLFVWLMED